MKDFENKMAFAAKQYEDGKLSLGQAAAFVGISKRAFMESIGQLGISIINYPTSDLSSDVANA